MACVCPCRIRLCGKISVLWAGQEFTLPTGPEAGTGAGFSSPWATVGPCRPWLVRFSIDTQDYFPPTMAHSVSWPALVVFSLGLWTLPSLSEAQWSPFKVQTGRELSYGLLPGAVGFCLPKNDETRSQTWTLTSKPGSCKRYQTAQVSDRPGSPCSSMAELHGTDPIT